MMMEEGGERGHTSDDRLEEGLEDTAGFFVDHGGDTLDTTTTGETTDGRLGDTLDVVAEDLAMTLRTTGVGLVLLWTGKTVCIPLAESFAAFATYERRVSIGVEGELKVDGDRRDDATVRCRQRQRQTTRQFESRGRYIRPVMIADV
jgi:hypothetical protein